MTLLLKVSYVCEFCFLWSLRICSWIRLSSRLYTKQLRSARLLKWTTQDTLTFSRDWSSGYAYKRDALEPLFSPLFARSRTKRRFPIFWSISTPMTALNFSYWSRHQSVYCGCIGTDPRKLSSVFLSTRWRFHRKRSLSYCTGWYQCVRKVSETAITLPSRKV